MAKKNYVNNPEFLKAIIEYKKACKEAEEFGEDDLPQIPNYIGECLYQIATRLSTKPNFSGYTYREEMVSDGLENAIQALGNFDPEKSNNPFAYFTQIIWYAFLRRIEKEKKQVYIRHKVIENYAINENAFYEDSEETGQSSNIDFENDYMNDFVSNYEDRVEKRRKKSTKGSTQKKGLENFVDDFE